MNTRRLILIASACALCGQLFAADAPEKKPATKPQAAAKKAAPSIAPTEPDVRYGEHERQVLDFYQAKSSRATPVLFFIHGGGWVSGDKKNPGSLKECLAAGISVVSINYRYSWQAQLAGVKPPVKAPLEDAARALQFVRSKAKEWNLDKQRISTPQGTPHPACGHLLPIRCGEGNPMGEGGVGLSPFEAERENTPGRRPALRHQR